MAAAMARRKKVGRRVDLSILRCEVEVECSDGWRIGSSDVC